MSPQMTQISQIEARLCNLRNRWMKIQAIREPLSADHSLDQEATCTAQRGVAPWAGAGGADGTREATPLGVPQGGPLSPLLANITLDPLDKEIERRGHVHARYADELPRRGGAQRKQQAAHPQAQPHQTGSRSR